MVLNTPPMGWNTWNTFGENINEQLIMETADMIVEKGYKDAGYEYVVIDDCWSMRKRDENGQLVADPVKFPHGMKYVADYIHSKGLKFGMYSCCGPLTCASYPGSLDHELDDALFFAENGVDYLKYDWCYHPMTLEGWTLYNRMKMALAATGRDIVFSVCNWGDEDTHSWIRKVGGDLYRSTGDIFDSFRSIKDIIDKEVERFNQSGPSCYNDIDMLVCGMYGKGNVGGDGGCDTLGYETHFKLWCMLSAPLMIGGDIRNLDERMEKLLMNKELIRINQDPEQRPPIVMEKGNVLKLFRHVCDGEYVLSMTNFTDSPAEYNIFNLPDVGFPGYGEWGLELYDVDTGEYFGTFTTDVWVKHVEPHETKMYRGKVVKLR